MNHTARSAADPHQQLPQPGDVVAGKYRIDGVIGTGGMGVVMGAVDTSLGRPVAIKFLSPGKARRDGAVQRFIREARAAASLQSEHVVRVFEVGTLPSGAPFIVMEQLRGSDLSQMVHARGGLPVEEAVDYLIQACEALGEAHGRGIVHRDLKPQNLFISPRPDGSPCLKILDFGISKAADDEAPNLTATDTVMGTPLYMSPEQVRSLKNVDARSDIWALGSILFELLTASPIFEAPSATALCAMIAMDPPTPLRARRPMAPYELELLILRCLHKDPNGRFQDVAALAEALGPFATDRGRQSALRVSQIVRASSSNAARAGSGVPMPSALEAPTVDGSGRHHAPGLGPGGYPSPTIGPSAYPAAQVSSAFPPGMYPQPHHVPNTQHTWQQTSTRTGDIAPAQGRGMSPMLVAFLGVVTGLVVLAVIGGAGYAWFYSKTTGPVALASDAGGGAAVPANLAPSSAAPPSTSASPAAVTPTGTSKPTGPAAQKDAGAPAPQAQKDAGAPAPKPSAAPGMTREEEIASLKRTAESRCSMYRFQLSQNDPKTNSQARQVQTMTCLRAQSMSPNSGAANCDRQVCRQACAMLQDQACLRQLDYAEANTKLPY
jgi:eukaryotic-like serine/threonine-protein kinase